MRFPLQKARAHLIEKANTWPIVWVDTVDECAADYDERVVYTVRPTTMAKYMVGLHEIGHLHHPHTAGLVNEAQAWAWAAINSHPDFEPWRDYRLWRTLSSYFATHLPWPGDPAEPA